MKQKTTFSQLNLPLIAKNGSKAFEMNLQRLTSVFITLGMSIVIGSHVALASPYAQRSNPYVTVWNPSTIGSSRTSSGSIGGTLAAAIKYGWDFSAIASAFENAGLTETLSNQDISDPNTILYTVFVPTDEAWQALNPSIRNNPETLENILRYHIVPGAVTQSQLESGQIQTLSGGNISVETNNDQFVLNQDVAVTSSIRTQNGVIVFVNKPLIPQN
jgi:hypothetical protein